MRNARRTERLRGSCGSRRSSYEHSGSRRPQAKRRATQRYEPLVSLRVELHELGDSCRTAFPAPSGAIDSDPSNQRVSGTPANRGRRSTTTLSSTAFRAANADVVDALDSGSHGLRERRRLVARHHDPSAGLAVSRPYRKDAPAQESASHQSLVLSRTIQPTLGDDRAFAIYKNGLREARVRRRTRVEERRAGRANGSSPRREHSTACRCSSTGTSVAAARPLAKHVLIAGSVAWGPSRSGRHRRVHRANVRGWLRATRVDRRERLSRERRRRVCRCAIRRSLALLRSGERAFRIGLAMLRSRMPRCSCRDDFITRSPRRFSTRRSS